MPARHPHPIPAYAILAGSLPTPHPGYGVPYGAAVFAGDYIALPAAGLYKPIWQYDAKTLAWDLSAPPRQRRGHQTCPGC